MNGRNVCQKGSVFLAMGDGLERESCLVETRNVNHVVQENLVLLSTCPN